MEISGAKMIFLFGCLGGISIELLRWWKYVKTLSSRYSDGMGKFNAILAYKGQLFKGIVDE